MSHRAYEVIATILACVVCTGLAILGWQAAANLNQLGVNDSSLLTVTRHRVRTETETIRRVTHGRVITLPGGVRVVHVPLLLVHTQRQTIRVPAHNVRLRSAGATIAQPLEPITITVPVTTTITVPVPTTVTSTETVTAISTVTLPLSVPAATS